MSTTALRRSAPRAPAPPASPRALLADELPASLRPDARDRRLVAALAWGDELLEVRDVDPRRRFTVGPAGSTFPVPSGPLPRPVPLLQPLPGGAFLVLVPPGLRASVRLDGEERPVEALLRTGRAHAVEVPFRGAAFLLGLHERATFVLGDLRLVLRHARTPSRERRPWLARLDAPFLTLVIVAALVGGMLARMFAITDFGRFVHEEDLIRNPQIWVRRAPPPKPPVVFSQPRGGAPGPEGTRGRPEAPRRLVAPPRPGGPVDAARRQQNQEFVRNQGILGALQASGPSLAAILGGGGPINGLNALAGPAAAGAQVGDGQGVWGLGTRGGDTGGGDRTVGIGGPGPAGWGTDPRGRLPGLDLPAGRKAPGKPEFPRRPEVTCENARGVIGRAVRNHHSEIRYCYERELAKDPNLVGKVLLGFDILPSGDIVSAQVRESTLASPAAEQCMRQAVERWRIPLPAGCGTVQVNYPFLFQASSGGSAGP